MERNNASTSNAQTEKCFEAKKNYFYSICRSGNVYALMELAPFIGNDGQLLHEYDHLGRMCTHMVARCDPINAVMKIEILLNMGADINARENKTGDTLLHIAASDKNYQLAEWLCKEPRFNLSVINFAHQTPYHVAYFSQDQRMMEIIRTNGAACDVPVDSDCSVED